MSMSMSILARVWHPCWTTLETHRFVEQRIEELERQEAAALAAALAAAATLPSLTLPPRRRYTAGIISPRLGSPSYLASKGFSSFGGFSTPAAAEEGWQAREATKVGRNLIFLESQKVLNGVAEGVGEG